MGYKYNIPEYKILKEEDIEKIHEISLDILENIGAKIPHDEVLEILYENGAKIDKDKKVAKFPREMVEKAIETAGKKCILYGRNRNNKAEFGYGMFNFVTTSGQYQIVDQETNTRRDPTIADFRNGIKMGDALENITVHGGLVVPTDVDPKTSDIVTFYELLTKTSKPFTAWFFNGKSTRTIIEMMEVAAGSREELLKHPFCRAVIEPISPLTFMRETIEVLVEFAKAGLPYTSLPITQAGSTAPCSLSGTIAQHNAEVLVGIVIAQSVSGGKPVPTIYGASAHVFDMKTGIISYGAPEGALTGMALVQIGKSYGFPVFCATAGLSDAKAIDAQYGIETGITISFGALAGADRFGNEGAMGSSLGANLTQLVIDNERASHLTRILSGFDLSELEDSYKQLEKEGISGNFLINEMTVNNFKKEVWYSDLFDRASWEAWEKNGATDVVERAIEKKNKILKEHELLPIADDIEKELRRILKINKIDIKP